MNLRPSSLVHVVSGLILATLTSGAMAADVYWTGTTGSLVDPANWANETLPTSADNAAVSNGGTATMGAGDFAEFTQLWVGMDQADTPSTGNLVQTGGDLYLSDGLVVGRRGSAVGTYTMTGGYLDTYRLRVGGGTTTASGTMTISGADTLLVTRATDNVVGVGTPGTGTLTLSDSATWIHGGTQVVLVGADNDTINAPGGGHGTLNIQSNAVVRLETSNLAIGRNNGSVGLVTIDGGTLELLGANALINVGSVHANNNTSIAGTGTLTLESGNLSVSRIRVANNAGGLSTSGSGTVNLNGGVATVGGFLKGGGTAVIHFNGGTVKASEANADYFSGFYASHLDVQAGGLKFDTNHLDVTFTQGLSGEGGLTKLGAGTLTLAGASSYAGGTLVNGGTLRVAADGVLGNGSIVVTDGGLLDFDVDFSLTTGGLVLENGGTLALDQNLSFAGVTIGGAALAEGVYDYDTLKAQYAGFFLDGGSGQITVTAVPEPSTIALMILGTLAALHLRRRHVS